MPKSKNEESKADDIWTKIDRDGIQVETTDKASNSSVVFVGDQGCGKSSLIQSFLKPSASKDTKPTIALEYNYARRTVNGTKQVANLWEVGGDLQDSKLVEIGITVKNLTCSAVVICCDLSKPHNVLNSILRSISAVKEVISKRIGELQASNVNAVNDIRAQLAEQYKEHVDSNRLRWIEVPLYIVANKFDLFKSLPSSDRRNVFQVLRLISHFFGATLLTMANNDSTMKEAYRSLITAVCFNQPIKPVYELNTDRFVYCTRGQDNFNSILLGEGAHDSDGKSKSRLANSEAEIEFYLTHKGVTRDCWSRMSDHMTQLFGEADPVQTAGSGAGDMEVSGVGDNEDKQVFSVLLFDYCCYCQVDHFKDIEVFFTSKDCVARFLATDANQISNVDTDVTTEGEPSHSVRTDGFLSSATDDMGYADAIRLHVGDEMPLISFSHQWRSRNRTVGQAENPTVGSYIDRILCHGVETVQASILAPITTKLVNSNDISA